MAKQHASIAWLGPAVAALLAGPALAQGPCGVIDVDLDAQESFGNTVAMDGERLVIGAPDALTPNGPGSAYVFKRIGGAWELEQRLLADDGDDWDRFGDAVAISGDLIVVGARYDEPEFWTGSAYVFRHDGKQWNQEQKLTASNGAQLDQFGRAVAVFGNWVLVGATSTDHESVGSTYAFEFDGNAWVERQELRVSDRDQRLGYLFGHSIDMHDDMALIGASWDHQVLQKGAVYMFRLEDGAWVERQKMVASDGEENEKFGRAVAFDGTTAVFGVFPTPQRAHVWILDGDQWIEDVQLTAEEVGLGDHFATDVAISGDLIALGASGDDDNAENAGAAYVFRREGDTWHEHVKLLAPNGFANDRLSAVGVLGETAVAGAYGSNREGSSAGAAYVFEGIATDDCNVNGRLDSCDIASGASPDDNGDGVPDECEPPCFGDLDDDDDVGLADLLRILSLWGPCEGACPEDLDASGAVDLGDLLIVLSRWGPCLPIGACCRPDGTCSIEAWAACLDAGGLYQGHGTTCADCPTGACCFPDGTCLNLFEAQCAEQAGIFLGVGTACVDGCAVFLADECEDAPAVGEGVYLFSTLDATWSMPFELPAECEEGNGTDFRNDVWARYTAACDGTATAGVCDSSFDTRMAVYAPEACPGAFIACNDDACGEDGTRSRVSFPVSAGSTYLIRVGAPNSSLRGSGFLEIECASGE